MWPLAWTEPPLASLLYTALQWQALHQGPERLGDRGAGWLIASHDAIEQDILSPLFRRSTMLQDEASHFRPLSLRPHRGDLDVFG